MLADMAVGIETARLATQRAAWEVDQVSSKTDASKSDTDTFPFHS